MASALRPARAARGLLLAMLIAVAGCAEYLPFAGGRLEGEVMPPPADWTELASAKVVQLETNPADPYSVNLWAIGDGPRLYVHAGANRTTWVEHIDADPDVRVKIGPAIYELRAERVTDAAEFRRFADAWEAKYGNQPRNGNVAEAYLFRLLPRG